MREPVDFDSATNELRKDGHVVGLTDRIYALDRESIVLDEILVKGDLSGPLAYNGRMIEIIDVETIVGLEIGSAGVRGPVWKGVRCRVLDLRVGVRAG
ncbi:MAG: hypothetical protein M3P30_09335 [Chloroflexota bacterium]|nr:hypothetical protein [Chloroflexota bacterium]